MDSVLSGSQRQESTTCKHSYQSPSYSGQQHLIVPRQTHQWSAESDYRFFRLKTDASTYVLSSSFQQQPQSHNQAAPGRSRLRGVGGVAKRPHPVQELLGTRSCSWVPSEASLEERACFGLPPSFRKLLSGSLPRVRHFPSRTLVHPFNHCGEGESWTTRETLVEDDAHGPHIEGWVNSKFGACRVCYDGLWWCIAEGAAHSTLPACTQYPCLVNRNTG
jgi:hypothetical protein